MKSPETYKQITTAKLAICRLPSPWMETTTSSSSVSSVNSPAFSFPSTTHEFDKSLNEIHGKVERFEKMRQIAHDTQKLHKEKVFEAALNRGERIQHIQEEQKLLYATGIGSLVLVGVLCLVELATAGFTGIRWAWKGIKRAREKQPGYVDEAASKVQTLRLHSRDWSASNK
jgi:hypothetical protein